MSSDNFNDLKDLDKHQLVFDAEKVDEVHDGFITFSLFKLDNLYIEVRTSPDRTIKKSIRGYELKELPLIYTCSIFKSLGG